MDFVRHDFWKWLLLVRGSGMVEGDWGQPVCKTGDLIAVPPGLRHRIVDHPRQPISLYGLGIAPRVLTCVPTVAAFLPSGVLPASELSLLHLKRRMRRLLFTHARRDPPHQLATVAAALDLVAEVTLARQNFRHAEPQPASLPASSEPGEADLLLESYLAWLDGHFYEPQSLAQAASACGLARRSFTTAFRRRTGHSWLEYINRLRVRHAITLLQTTDRKTASIAFQSGFDDLSTFYRVFHRVTGQRPGQWREKN